MLLKRYIFVIATIIRVISCSHTVKYKSELWDQGIFDLLVPNMPDNVPSQVLERLGYITSYNKETKCPNWVAWHLTKDHTDGPYSRKGVPYYDNNGNAIGIALFNSGIVRGDYFVDLQVPAPRQEHTDWQEHPSNIDHGHICPAADNKWSKDVMNQSFLLTNMCPQNHDLNAGDWEDLEERCRSWAKRYGKIYIVAGPIFENGVTKTMGGNKIGIPDGFFKVILCMKGKPKAIGFIYKNVSSRQPMRNQVKSVDEVEVITGYDFFSEIEDSIEDKIESQCNLDDWR